MNPKVIWQNLKVSQDQTHHIDERGQPIYHERFDEVLKFHDPGLAPVKKNGKSWHIKTNGLPAYAYQFQKCFGFYEKIAAVQDDQYFFYHISLDGKRIYQQNYLWCGNFQEGFCSVRNLDNSYHHINRNGENISNQSWRYVGDFKDGIAVVQNMLGLSTHMNTNGELIHHKWFVDLDVYHKGFARAKTDKGWTHIDLKGNVISQRFFMMIEPFYNGQARVENFDGSLEIIDQQGNCILELRQVIKQMDDTLIDCSNTKIDQQAQDIEYLSGYLVSFWKTWAIYVAVELGIFDILPNTINKIAKKTSISRSYLERLLYALWEIKLVEKKALTWKCTQLGVYLKSEHFMSASAKLWGKMNLEWSNLLNQLKSNPTHQIPFKLTCDQNERMIYAKALDGYTAIELPSLINYFNLFKSQNTKYLGFGRSSAHLIEKISFQDQHKFKHPVWASDPNTFEGLSNLQNTSFHSFQLNKLSTLNVQSSQIIFYKFLHAYSDEFLIAILSHIHKGIDASSQIYIIEMILDDQSQNGRLFDLNMFVEAGGQVRTKSHYLKICMQSGFRIESFSQISETLQI